MKKLILIISLLFLYASCGSVKKTQKSLSAGNYSKTIDLAVENLKKNKSKKRNQPYVLMLQEAFKKSVKRDLDQIKFLKKENNPTNLEAIYNLYLDLNQRQELIKPLLPLPILKKGKNAIFKIENYDADLIQSKEKLVSYLYEKSLKSVQSDDKQVLRTVYNDLLYLDRIYPNYKNVTNLLNEVHQKGTDYVYVSIKNETQQIIPKRLEQDLLNFGTYGLDDIWTVYHSRKNPELAYDFRLELNLRRIDISPEQIKEKEIIKEKQLKDGYKFLLDTDGNFVKDSLGNKIKVDKFIDVKCKFYETSQFKSTRVVGQVKYYNYKTHQLIDVFPIESEFVFEHFYATYDGDKRALNNAQKELLNNRFVRFPSNEQMVYDTGTDLKEQLKQIIIANAFRE